MGTWKALGKHAQCDVLLLLTDGTVLALATRRSKYRLIRPGKDGGYLEAKAVYREDLPGADFEHPCAVLADGRVFKLGSSTPHLYDPVEATWTPLANPVSGSKSGLLVLADGRVMLEDEMSQCTVSLYDPDTGSWVSASGLTDRPNGGPRVLLPDGRVFALTSSHVHLFEPVSKT